MHTRHATILAIAAIGLLVASGPAAAHAKLVRAEPKPGSSVRQAPGVVRTWFQEELNTKASTLQVTDRSGRRVDAGTGGVDLDDLDRKSMVVKLKTLGPGTYVVRWKAVSADDQNVARGSFRFTVAVASRGTAVRRVAAAQSAAIPPLRLVSPAEGATIANPVRVVVETPADLSTMAMGGDHMGGGPVRHLHVDIGRRMTMPTMRQIAKVGDGRYRITLGRVAAGRHTIRAYWADEYHKAMHRGHSITVTVR